jgi:hypothetical protein
MNTGPHQGDRVALHRHLVSLLFHFALPIKFLVI